LSALEAEDNDKIPQPEEGMMGVVVVASGFWSSSDLQLDSKMAELTPHLSIRYWVTSSVSCRSSMWFDGWRTFHTAAGGGTNKHIMVSRQRARQRKKWP